MTITATGDRLTAGNVASFSACSALMANGPAAGSLAWLRPWNGSASVNPAGLGLIADMVAGLGMIVPAAGYVSPLGRLFIGITGSLLTAFFTSEALGIAPALKMASEANFSPWGSGVLAALTWNGGLSFAILKLLDKTLGPRVIISDETEGLDISLQNEHGYKL